MRCPSSIAPTKCRRPSAGHEHRTSKIRRAVGDSGAPFDSSRIDYQRTHLGTEANAKFIPTSNPADREWPSTCQDLLLLRLELGLGEQPVLHEFAELLQLPEHVVG